MKIISTAYVDPLHLVSLQASRLCEFGDHAFQKYAEFGWHRVESERDFWLSYALAYQGLRPSPVVGGAGGGWWVVLVALAVRRSEWCCQQSEWQQNKRRDTVDVFFACVNISSITSRCIT